MNAVIETKSGALAHYQNSGRMDVADIIAHIATVQEVMRAVMKPDVHYGTIPGTPNPTLYKQGAEVLCMVFRITDSYQVEDLSTEDVVRYRVTCTGNHQINGVVLGTGMGEASSGEEKYKWRKAICKEEFDETPSNMRRVKHSRGKGGTTYKQEQIRTGNADLANTILKMANKRAKIAMTINVTACGDMFGQDLDDMDEALRDHLTRHEGDAPATPATPAALPTYTDEAFAKNLPIWRGLIESGKKTAEQIIQNVSKVSTMTDEQMAIVRATVVSESKPEGNAE
jgi:hypothetical protein